MMNKEVVKEMLQRSYNELAYTDQYIMGYIKKGVVYATFTVASVVDKVTCLDKASGKAGYSLRFRPNNTQRDFLMAYGTKTIVLGSKERFEAEFKESKYNRGEIFEKWVTEYFGQTWVKDATPFTENGDITIEEVAYQIKFEKTTFCNEQSIAGLRK